MTFECTLLVLTLYITESVFKIALLHGLCEDTGVCPLPCLISFAVILSQIWVFFPLGL